MNANLINPHFLQKFAIPPVFPDDDDKTRSAKLLYRVVLILLVLALLYYLAMPFVETHLSVGLLTNSLTILVYVGVLWLARRGRVRLASMVFAILFWCTVTCIALAYGGVLTPAFISYFTAIVIVGVLLGGRCALICAAASIVANFALFWLEVNGWQPPPLLTTTPFSMWWITGINYLMIVALLQLTWDEIVTTLARARAQLAEQQRMESALRASEERYRLISTITSDYTFSSRFNAHDELEHTLLTGAFEAITGYTPDEFLALGGWRACLHPDDVAQDDADMLLLRSNQSVITEVRIFRKDKTVRWVRVYAKPIWDTEQNILVGISGGVRDITESKQAQDALRESEHRYRILAENIPNSVVILFDTDLRFILVDGPEVMGTGYSKAALEGKTIFEALPSEFVAIIEPNMRAVLQGKQFSMVLPFENRFYHYHYVPLLNAGHEIMLGMILGQNVTAQKQLEAELQRYNAELETMVEVRTAEVRSAKDQIEIIIENTYNAIALIQPNGDVKLANPAFHTTFDQKSAQHIEQMLHLAADPASLDGIATGLLTAIQDNQLTTVSTRFKSADGLERDLDLTFVPVMQAAPMPTSVILSAHDITRVKEIERFKERFVANAVHDLSTPISGLSTRLYLLQRSPERLHDHVQSLERQVDHLRNLLEDLRTLSELDSGSIRLERSLTDFNTLVLRVFDTYEPVAMEKFQNLNLQIEPTLPLIVVDSRQIERVVANLVSNAINYTPVERGIIIKTLWHDGWLLLEVADEGMGIAPDDQTRVFERFFRTDKARSARSSGTGLGLAIVKEIVELHGGSVSLKSEIGVGSIFTIWLPL
jgi:PAS domain S-box-containing protein